MINEDVREIVEAELRDGEELLWADRPARKRIYILPIFYLLFLGIFTFYFVVLAVFLSPALPRGNILWYSLVFVIGGHLIMTINGWVKRSRAVFGLSYNRLFWVSKNVFNCVVSEDIDRIYEAVPVTNGQMGKIIFKRVPSHFFASHSMDDALYSIRYLHSISNAQEVAQLINKHISLRNNP